LICSVIDSLNLAQSMVREEREIQKEGEREKGERKRERETREAKEQR
jgi:hypothetical protein